MEYDPLREAGRAGNRVQSDWPALLRLAGLERAGREGKGEGPDEGRRETRGAPEGPREDRVRGRGGVIGSSVFLQN